MGTTSRPGGRSGRTPQRGGKGSPSPRLQPRLQWQRPWLYPAQERFLFHRARYVVVEASTKSGKTTGCLIWLTEQACLLGAPGRRFWWVAPSHSQAKIAYTRFKRWATRGLFKWNDTDQVVTLPNQATLEFKTAEKPDLLYGDDVWAVVLDEASRMREEAWWAIRSTLTFTRGRVRIIGNVKGSKNWYFKLARSAEQATASGEPNSTLYYQRLTAYDAVDAGVLDLAEVEDAKRMLPADVFAELYLAEAADDGGNPFSLKAIRDRVGEYAERYPGGAFAPGPIVVWGIDLGSLQSWTVLVGLNAQGEVAAFHRFRKSWPETLSEVRRLVGMTPAVIDATGVGKPIVETLQREGQLPILIDQELKDAAARGDHNAVKILAQQEQYNAQIKAACPNLIPFLFTGPSRQGLLEGLALAIQQALISFPSGPNGVLQMELESAEYKFTHRTVTYDWADNVTNDCVMALALANEGRRTAALRPSYGGFSVAL